LQIKSHCNYSLLLPQKMEWVVRMVFRLTAFGQAMYQVRLQIDEAVQHFSVLKVIDVIDENTAIEDDERQKLMTLLMEKDTEQQEGSLPESY